MNNHCVLINFNVIDKGSAGSTITFGVIPRSYDITLEQIISSRYDLKEEWSAAINKTIMTFDFTVRKTRHTITIS